MIRLHTEIQNQETQNSFYTEQCQIHFFPLFRFSTISRDNNQYLFQFRHVIFFLICPRTLYNYPPFWILRNQWAEKAYTFSGKQLCSHSTTSRKEMFSGKSNTTEHCYSIICLSYPKFYCCNLIISSLTECLLFIVC